MIELVISLFYKMSDKEKTEEDQEKVDKDGIPEIYHKINADWYSELWNDRKSVIDLYFDKLRQCESNRLIELNASISIQNYFRMHQLRKRFHLLNHSATEIQRIFRGYQARNYVKYEVRIKHKIKEQQLFYDQMAILIQKVFRGYFSRKYFLNFYARKQYIQQITHKSNKLLNELRDQYEKNMETQKRMEEMQKAEKFDKLIGNLHHLLSTKRIKGIFKSPFGNEFSATAYGISMEKHIQQKFHQQFESKYYLKNEPFQQSSKQTPQ